MTRVNANGSDSTCLPLSPKSAGAFGRLSTTSSIERQRWCRYTRSLNCKAN